MGIVGIETRKDIELRCPDSSDAGQEEDRSSEKKVHEGLRTDAVQKIMIGVPTFAS